MHSDVSSSLELSLQNFGSGIGYIDLFLLHCAYLLLLRVNFQGPIAFKADEDGIGVAVGPEGMVDPVVLVSRRR